MSEQNNQAEDLDDRYTPSEQKWTPEPWLAHGADIRTNADERVNIYDMDPSNRERIVACVNALAGVADPAAELARLRGIEKVYAAAAAECEQWRNELGTKNGRGNWMAIDTDDCLVCGMPTADAHDTARAEAGMGAL